MWPARAGGTRCIWDQEQAQSCDRRQKDERNGQQAGPVSRLQVPACLPACPPARPPETHDGRHQHQQPVHEEDGQQPARLRALGEDEGTHWSALPAAPELRSQLERPAPLFSQPSHEAALCLLCSAHRHAAVHQQGAQLQNVEQARHQQAHVQHLQGLSAREYEVGWQGSSSRLPCASKGAPASPTLSPRLPSTTAPLAPWPTGAPTARAPAGRRAATAHAAMRAAAAAALHSRRHDPPTLLPAPCNARARLQRVGGGGEQKEQRGADPLPQEGGRLALVIPAGPAGAAWSDGAATPAAACRCYPACCCPAAACCCPGLLPQSHAPKGPLEGQPAGVVGGWRAQERCTGWVAAWMLHRSPRTPSAGRPTTSAAACVRATHCGSTR